MEEGAMVAKELAPIDTSSLSESIRVSNYNIDGDRVTVKLIAGGIDYSHTYFSSTGKIGNVVDYAMQQESIHNFMGQSIPTIIDRIENS
jgi:subtilisin family serine protease